MVRRNLTRDQAFDLLSSTSQSSNRKIRDLAADVVYTGTLGEPRPV